MEHEMISIGDVIKRVEEWKNKQVEIQELTEGLTNHNYKVTVDNRSYVVRIPGSGTDVFVDRDKELHNTLSASDVGVGAKVFYSFKSDHVIIIEFLKGKVMSPESFKGNDVITRTVKAIKEVNTKGNFVSNFVMFDKFDEYHEIVKKHTIKLPDNFNEAENIVRKVESRFLRNMPKLVSCHNDLLAENFIDQGNRMRIIDWELSGLNDPCFELGDFSVEQGFNENENKLIIETYFGHFDEQKYARMNVYKYMADVLWTLWAVIQNHFSVIDFDFWEYGLNRFNRAMNAFNSADFPKWLEIA
jgi:thiamine kinase-like enzyme